MASSSATARRRRPDALAGGRATKRTMSSSQSRSVRSTEVVGAGAADGRRRCRPAGRRRPRRSARGARRWRSGPRAASPVSGSTSVEARRRRAARARGGRRPRRTSTSWRAASAAQRPLPAGGRRGSRTRRRRGPGGGRAGQAASRAAAEVGRCRRRRPAALVTSRCSSGHAGGLAAGAGRDASTCRRAATSTAPMRLPVRAVRKPMAAAAARARSRFSQTAVPKSRLAEQVDEHPRLQLAVGDGLADVGRRACGR